MKRFGLNPLWLIISAVAIVAQNHPTGRYTIQTLIGQGYRGDGGPANKAVLDSPAGMAQDGEGNVYIAESKAGVIRRVRASDGVIERFAGAGESADSIPGRPALETNILTPTVLLAAQNGEGLLFAESQSCRIRMVRTNGTISDVAGSGRCSGTAAGPGGGGGGTRDRPALETDIGTVGGMAFDGQGRLIFTETDGHIVRRIDADGYARVIAGNRVAGFSGDAGAATSASLNAPVGIAIDANGDIYIADSNNCRVRKVRRDGVIETAFGGISCATSTATYVGGPRTTLERVGAIAFDPVSNAMLIAMPRVYRVVRYDFGTARMAPFLGDGKLGAADSEAPLQVNLNAASAILPLADGTVLVSSGDSYRVYGVKDGASFGFAGMWPQVDAYPSAAETQLVRPMSIWHNADSSILIVDTGAGRILRYSPSNAEETPDEAVTPRMSVTPVAGLAFPYGYDRNVTGPALQATLLDANRVAQSPDGNIYFSERSRIRMVSPDGMIQTVLDNLSQPGGLAFDSEGRLYFAETGRHQILRLEPGTKTTTVIAGTTSKSGFSGDGGFATGAVLNSPADIVFDRAGNLLIVDRLNYRVRKVAMDSGRIETVIGTGMTFNYSDITGLNAREVGFGLIDGIAVDAAGNLYVSEQLRIDRIGTAGKVEVLTGYLSEDDNGVRTFIDGPLNGVAGLAVDDAGQIYAAVRQDGKVLVMRPR
jgi:sugar lactone lactonase YvrE